MMRAIKTVCALLATMLLATSCLKSDNDSSTLYTDAAISSFSLGTLNRYLHTVSSEGTDSVYKVTVTGSDYKFSIDQENHRIFNTDSLPVGTDVEHVICSITSVNNGLITIKNIDSDTLVYYSSTDSIDFSVDRQLNVYANDGTSYQSYTVSVNVHKQDGDVFNWQRMADNSDFAALQGMRAVSLSGRLLVFGSNGTTTVGYATGDGNTWTELALDASAAFDADAYQQVQVQGDCLYVISGGELLKSDDGDTWETVVSSVPVEKLIAANSRELFALDAAHQLMVSNDGGQNWEADQLDEDASWFPTDNIASCYTTNKLIENADFVLVAGTSAAIGSMASVWRKISDLDYAHQSGQWVYIERTDKGSYALPQLGNLVLLPYDDSILALGYVGTTLSPLYQSRDNGLTWRSSKTYQLPADLDGSAAAFAAATDGVHFWLVSGDSGQVWRGTLNCLDWEN